MLFLIDLQVFAYESNGIEQLMENNKNYHYEDDEIIIYGNYDDLNKNILYTEFDKLNSKVLIIYFTMNNLSNKFKLNLYNNSITIFSKVNGVLNEDSYTLQSSEYDYLREEFTLFYREKINEKASTFNAYEVNEEESFTVMKTGSDRITAAPYGYIDINYVIKDNYVNATSSLYLIEFESSVVCGKMANMNGDSSYDKDVYHNYSYVHLLAEQSEDWEEAYYNGGVPRKGGVPILKDYWPINSPATATITSSYSVGNTIGYSYSNGFSTSPEIEIKNGQEFGMNIDYSYSKSYTNTEPFLSAQLSSANTYEAEWTYTYSIDKRYETTHTENNYLFEMNNSNHSMIMGDFDLYYDIKAYFNEYTKILFWETKTEHEIQLEKTVNIWNH